MTFCATSIVRKGPSLRAVRHRFFATVHAWTLKDVLDALSVVLKAQCANNAHLVTGKLGKFWSLLQEISSFIWFYVEVALQVLLAIN